MMSSDSAGEEAKSHGHPCHSNPMAAIQNKTNKQTKQISDELWHNPRISLANDASICASASPSLTTLPPFPLPVPPSRALPISRAPSTPYPTPPESSCHIWPLSNSSHPLQLHPFPLLRTPSKLLFQLFPASSLFYSTLHPPRRIPSPSAMPSSLYVPVLVAGMLITVRTLLLNPSASSV